MEVLAVKPLIAVSTFRDNLIGARTACRVKQAVADMDDDLEEGEVKEDEVSAEEVAAALRRQV